MAYPTSKDPEDAFFIVSLIWFLKCCVPCCLILFALELLPPCYLKAYRSWLGLLGPAASLGSFFKNDFDNYCPLQLVMEIFQLYTVSLLCDHQILTKDAVTVSVEAVIYYRISDASAVVNQLENHRFVKPIRGKTLNTQPQLSQLFLKKYICTKGHTNHIFYVPPPFNNRDWISLLLLDRGPVLYSTCH